MHDDINKDSPRKDVRSNEYFFTVLQVPTWEIARKCGRFLRAGWAYRGQSAASWNLSSTIERSASSQGYPLQMLHWTERFMVEQFIRRAHHFLPDPPRPEKLLEWLAVIQHYGGPTRLLDFTRSFYVAAYFACENATSDFAVWAVNTGRLEDHFKDAAKIDKKLTYLNSETVLRPRWTKLLENKLIKN